MTEQASTYTVTTPTDKAGSRLDRLLADAIPELSRTRLQALIVSGLVTDADHHRVVDPSARVREGQSFRVAIPSAPEALAPQRIPLDVVHEDDDLIVIDKPAGLVVHPGAGNPDGTLVNALLALLPGGLSTIGAPLRPGIVHRIDKDTSGLLVVAKTDFAHVSLAAQFAGHSVDRAYHALVWGNPNPASGRIEKRIGRGANRVQMAAVDRGGKTAVTFYETQKRYGSLASLLHCRLATGRTHQIRVHMSSIGHSLIGDPLYGRRGAPQGSDTGTVSLLRGFPRQALHAFLIGFKHPRTGDDLRFSSALPFDFKQLLDLLDAS